MPTSACSSRGVIRDPASAWASNISVSVIPPWRRGNSTSVLHQSVSVSAIRRRASAQTRSHPSMTAGRNPIESWSSIARTTDSSSTRTWSSGRGSAKPTASRTTRRRSKGTPVSSLSCWKVVPLIPREPIERGRIQVRERERSFPHGGGHPVERDAGLLPAPHPPRPAHVAGRERVLASGCQDAELDQAVDVLQVDPAPCGPPLGACARQVGRSSPAPDQVYWNKPITLPSGSLK